MSSPVDRLRAAHAAKLETEAALAAASALEHAAIAEARAAGVTLQAIGDAVGITRAGVLYLLKRDGVHVPVKVAKAEARLEALDARWEHFVDELTAAFFVDPDAQREQLRRNTENGKRKRKNARAASAARRRGFGTTAGVPLVPTVKSDARRAAETFALRYIDEHRAHPVIAKVVGELDEAALLREQLQTSGDPVWLHD